MSALSDLLTRANIEGLSTQRLTVLMRQRGHQISRDTVWRYLSGRNTRVSDTYLRAFSDVLPELDLDELRRVAAVPPDLGAWQPPPEARALSPRERGALELIIKSIARGKVPTDSSPAHLPSHDQETDPVEYRPDPSLDLGDGAAPAPLDSADGVPEGVPDAVGDQ